MCLMISWFYCSKFASYQYNTVNCKYNIFQYKLLARTLSSEAVHVLFTKNVFFRDVLFVTAGKIIAVVKKSLGRYLSLNPAII